jgi:hypothetical protein
MTDLDRRLRHAGARLRDGAPTAADTDAALARLGDVALDDRPPRRRRLWIVAPAVVAAAAAAIVGVVVVTRPDETAIVPGGTTEVPAPTSTTISSTGLGFGVELETSNENFDGDGGACLTLSTQTDSATGCADGPTMRSAYGPRLSLRLDGAPYTLYPTGAEGQGEPEIVAADDVSPCVPEEPGVLTDVASCDSAGTAIVAVLPASPDGTVSWTVLPADGTTSALELVTASADLGARVFRLAGSPTSESCVLVATRADAAREACGVVPSVFLAGSPDAPLVLTYLGDERSFTLDALDAGATLGVNDCGDLTAGELLGLLPEHGTVDALLCGGAVGAVRVLPERFEPSVIETSWDLLERGDDGTWSVSESGVDSSCGSGLAAAVCSELGLSDLAQSLPFPSVASIAGFDQAVGEGSPLSGRPAFDEIPSVPPAVDLPSLAEAVRSALHAAQGLDGRVDVYSDSTPIVIRRTNLDDSVTETIFTLATGTVDSGVVVVAERSRAVDICGRGTTTLEGETVCV